jgi:hypothetical protein
MCIVNEIVIDLCAIQLDKGSKFHLKPMQTRKIKSTQNSVKPLALMGIELEHRRLQALSKDKKGRKPLGPGPRLKNTHASLPPSCKTLK